MNTIPTQGYVSGIQLPALRGRQGDRDMYMLEVPNTMLLRNFAAEAESGDADGTKRAQRSLDPRHAKDIADYITENAEDYVLGAVTYAIDRVDQAQHFHEVVPGSNVGFLVLPLDAELRCLDGQHRRAAIKIAADEDPEVLHDSTAVVLYVEDDYVKRRQMFSDMNATPKVVAKALNVSFDTRDPYAKTALRLADEHPLLAGVVEKEKARISARSTAIFSLAGVYDGLKRIVLGPTLPRGRSRRDTDMDDLLLKGNALFDTLSAARIEYREVAERVRTLTEAGDLSTLGGYMAEQRKRTLLLSTTTLRVIAGALHKAMERDGIDNPTAYTTSLSHVDFTPTSKLFVDAGYVTGTGTPNARNQEVQEATKVLTEMLHAR